MAPSVHACTSSTVSPVGDRLVIVVISIVPL